MTTLKAADPGDVRVDRLECSPGGSDIDVGGPCGGPVVCGWVGWHDDALTPMTRHMPDAESSRRRRLLTVATSTD